VRSINGSAVVSHPATTASPRAPGRGTETQARRPLARPVIAPSGKRQESAARPSPPTITHFSSRRGAGDDNLWRTIPDRFGRKRLPPPPICLHRCRPRLIQRQTLLSPPGARLSLPARRAAHSARDVPVPHPLHPLCPFAACADQARRLDYRGRLAEETTRCEVSRSSTCCSRPSRWSNGSLATGSACREHSDAHGDRDFRLRLTSGSSGSSGITASPSLSSVSLWMSDRNFAVSLDGSGPSSDQAPDGLRPQPHPPLFLLAHDEKQVLTQEFRDVAKSLRAPMTRLSRNTALPAGRWRRGRGGGAAARLAVSHRRDIMAYRETAS